MSMAKWLKRIWIGSQPLLVAIVVLLMVVNIYHKKFFNNCGVDLLHSKRNHNWILGFIVWRWTQQSLMCEVARQNHSWLQPLTLNWKKSAMMETIKNSVDILEHFLFSLDKIDKAIMMLYLDDISHIQISEITGQSVNVISVRINLMKQKFKQQHMDD
jgi:hypothetical protein